MLLNGPPFYAVPGITALFRPLRDWVYAWLRFPSGEPLGYFLSSCGLVKPPQCLAVGPLGPAGATDNSPPF